MTDFGRAGQRLVRLHDLAADGGEEVADGLDRLDDAEGGELLHGPADRRKLDEDDVAQLVGGVGGDPDGGHVALDADPLVLLRVAQVGRDHAALLSSVRRRGAGVLGPARGRPLIAQRGRM